LIHEVVEREREGGKIGLNQLLTYIHPFSLSHSRFFICTSLIQSKALFIGRKKNGGAFAPLLPPPPQVIQMMLRNNDIDILSVLCSEQ
jgi:hypothetical protein